MNTRQRELYGETFCEWGSDTKRFVGCNHCDWVVALRRGNALAVTARLRGLAMRHVKGQHPEIVEKRRLASDSQLGVLLEGSPR